MLPYYGQGPGTMNFDIYATFVCLRSVFSLDLIIYNPWSTC